MAFYYLLPFLGKEKCFKNHRFIEILLGRHLGNSITHLFSRSELREPSVQEVRQGAKDILFTRALGVLLWLSALHINDEEKY